MTAPDSHISRWPALPSVLQDLLSDIEAETEDDPRHARPWDLASLPDELREPVWEWLTKAVRWINGCYAWQPETVIPPCWRQHPHLALDLAVLAFGRELAYRSTKALEPGEWHDSLQTVQTRMVAAIGAVDLTECQKGGHRERPAAYALERHAPGAGDSVRQAD